ncbi:uncharacterized protein LOC131626800 isoform X2 [Vicia villosa]|uniref:uncharacterized protein LOC131626800 isoform X2 n=1 Tax=Vicia villosa TaxID=3911 RepID=UPI00273C0E46|nr:uncharacterized protein LOC131626800 isoform X2 [Vicia villosa]
MPSHKPNETRGSIFEWKKMDQNVEQKPPKINIDIPSLEITNSFKKQSQMPMSPLSQQPEVKKSSSGRWNCLCSPTTHVGSFRCRHHRSASGGMSRGRSVGSNLLELGNKAGPISDSLHAQ